MQLPDTIYLQGNQTYRIEKCGKKSGIDYGESLFELFVQGQFARHLLPLEVMLLRAGVEIGESRLGRNSRE